MKTTNKTDEEHRNSFFDELIEIAQEIRKETEEVIPKEEDYLTWVKLYDIWVDIFKLFMSPLSEFDKYNSLLFLRFVELQKQHFWLHFSVLSGVYHQSIRELRFILESTIQAYYIDREHPNATKECKLEIIKEIDRLTGGRLIDKADFRHKNELKVLYSDLCKYVHSSYEELRPTLDKGEVDYRVTLAFNKELFHKCKEFSTRVTDAFFVLMFSLYPKIIPTIRDNQLLLQSLNENNCALSIRVIEKEAEGIQKI